MIRPGTAKTTQHPRRLIGEALLEHDLITEDQLLQGLRYQPSAKKLLGETLVELGYLEEGTLLDFLTEYFNDFKSSAHPARTTQKTSLPKPDTTDIYKLFTFMVDQGASDLHLLTDNPPIFRKDGELTDLGQSNLTPEAIRALVYSILDYDEIEQFEQKKALDKALEIKGIARFRINLHRQRGSIGASIRTLPLAIPSFEKLRVPPALKDLASMPNGLVLVTGPAGSGKSTSLAATIEHINLTQKKNIVTIEDPIEYAFSSKKSLIRQRELGVDTLSFNEALKSVVRQDPNIILIGEMRDLDTIQTALTLAETGHLILSTLHTQEAVNAISRIVDVFPVEYRHEVQVKLSLVLQGVVVQRLLPRKDKKGRVLACEVLKCTDSVRNLIRANQLAQVRSFMQMGSKAGMKTMNQSLAELYFEGLISREHAFEFSNDRDELSHTIPR